MPDEAESLGPLRQLLYMEFLELPGFQEAK